MSSAALGSGQRGSSLPNLTAALSEFGCGFSPSSPPEVCQRIESHFMGINQMVRGASAAYRDFYPRVKSVGLDAREQRAAMKRNVEAARREAGDDALPASVIASLPKVPFGQSVAGVSRTELTERSSSGLRWPPGAVPSPC